jgi:hypothetical protein
MRQKSLTRIKVQKFVAVGKSEGKIVPVLNQMPRRGGDKENGGIAPATLDGVGSFTTGHVTPWRKRPRKPLDRRLGGPNRRPAHCGEEDSLCLLRIERRLFGRPSLSLVKIC